MPAKLKKTAVVSVDYSGQKSQSEVTEVSVKCDGPKCPGACPGLLEWNDSDPDKIPDNTARILTITEFYGRMYSFLSVKCLQEFLREYVPLLSKNEEARIAENNRRVDAKKAKTE